ncbi:MAG TPA: RraA family protein [Verrucomicrobiae bacterium]|jgi:regulator of RNase E activity RraA|nr:RraA family protein [Verrucomicrobiae bacterium]
MQPVNKNSGDHAVRGNGFPPELRKPSLTDGSRLQWIRESLYVPAVCDVLDSLGFRQQAMHYRLRPLDAEVCVIVGRARTFRWMETDYVVESDPYGLEIEAMDSLKAEDVVVHSTDTGMTNAPWGELMTTVALQNRAAGCVCDGLIRDCKKIMRLKFPVFHAGVRPVDSKGRGRVMAYDVPVRCGDVLVNPGDLVFADFDGVVVIPKKIEDKVLELAADKVGKESASRRELLKGRRLRDVYDEFGVL